MIEILFKAKRIDNGEWVEGYVVRYGYNKKEKWYIVPEYASDLYTFEIDEKTICQYTGMTDKNNNKIWENDVVEYRDFTDEKYVVVWETSKAMFEHQQYGCSIMNFDELSGMDVEVIGNIFDNPELLKGSE